MTYTEFTAEIKAGLPKSLYILTGPEDFLKEYSVGQAKQKLVDPSLEDFNFQSYSDVPDFALCSDFVNGMPMMSDRKLLVLRKCGFFGRSLKQKSDWEALFSNLPDTVCVLLWEIDEEKGKKGTASPVRKACENAGVTVEFPMQTEAKLIPWLAKIAMNGGKLIDKSCASYLIASLGRSMSVLKTEMQKVNAYARGEQITRTDIDAVIVRPAEDRVFKLVDAITDGRRDLGFEYLYELKQNRTEPVAFLSLFAGQVINIYKAKLLLGEGWQKSVALKKMGGGWAAEKSINKAARASEEGLENLIDMCQRADRDIKQGRMDPWTALEIIVSEAKIF
ncbi:MAG: DNA polymerase III subunit delta [Clostridia bacterium]